MKRVLGSLAIASLLSGCANFWSWYPNGEPPPPAAAPAPEPVPERPVGPNEYVVHRGDTLYSIAFRNQLDYRDVAKWNGIDSKYHIYPGQVLRLTSPSSQQIVSDDGGIVSRPFEIVDPPPARPVPLPPVASGSTSSWPTMPPGVPPPTSTSTSSYPPPSASMPRPAPIALPPPPASPPTDVAIAPPPGAYPAAPGSAPAAPMNPSAVPSTTTARMPPPPAPAGASIAMAPPPSAPGPAEAPFTSESGGPYRWQWPTEGVVVRGFNPTGGSKGLDFAGDLGQSVVAAAPGKVVYSGAALKGYGELVIIKHDDLRLSAYGYNRSRLVEEGDMVRGGQKIAELGLGPENKPILHFEIRERGQPVNPATYLPAKGAR